MPTLNHAFRLFKHNVRNTHMTVCGLVKCRRYNFCIHASAHIRHLLRTLINKKNHDVCLRMILRNRICNILEQNCLTGFGWSDDKSALTFSNRREHIDNTGRNITCTATCQIKLLIREKRSKMLKGHTVTYEFRRTAIDPKQTGHREILVVFTRSTKRALNHITGFNMS